MATVVQHNAAAQLALGELNKNISKVGNLLAKVSSGQKINSAKDDSASFCISEKMREQIRSLLQDNQNVQNGSALFKIADGGINSIVEELRNLKELAINAANDTNTDQDRAIMQKEFSQRMANINDIATETNYNGKRLLDGTYTKKFDGYETRVTHRERVWVEGTPGTSSEFPAPPYSSVYQNVSEPTGTVTAATGPNLTINSDGIYSLGAGFTGTVTVNAQNVKITQANPNTELSNVTIVGPSGGNANLWIENLNISNSTDNVIKFQGSNNVLTIRGSNTLTNTGSASSKAVINMGNGLTVQGNSNTTSDATLKINNKDSDCYGSGIGTDSGQVSSSDVAVVNANITLNMFHGAGIGSGGQNGGIGKITVENSTVNLTGMYFSGIGSGSQNASCGDIWIVSSNIYDLPSSEGVCGMSFGSIDTCIGSGYANSSCENIYILDSHVEAVNSDSPCIGAGDAGSTCRDILVSNSTIHSKTIHGAGVGSGRYSYVNGDITITNGTAITQISDEGAAIGSGLGGRVSGQIKISKSSLDLLDASRAYSDSTHSVPGIGRGLGGSADSVSSEIVIPSGSHWEEHLTIEATTVVGEVFNPLKIHHGPKANQHTNFYINDMHTKSLGTSELLGLDGRPTDTSDLERYHALSYDRRLQDNYLKTLIDASSRSLDDISVTTKQNANIAIRVIDGAIERAVDEATQMGAYLQRLEYTDINITTMGENVQSAESVIRDADMAKEMTEYTKFNVIQQSAQVMLAQANQNSSGVLSLLQ